MPNGVLMHWPHYVETTGLYICPNCPDTTVMQPRPFRIADRLWLNLLCPVCRIRYTIWQVEP